MDCRNSSLDHRTLAGSREIRAAPVRAGAAASASPFPAGPLRGKLFPIAPAEYLRSQDPRVTELKWVTSAGCSPSIGGGGRRGRSPAQSLVGIASCLTG